MRKSTIVLNLWWLCLSVSTYNYNGYNKSLINNVKKVTKEDIT